MSPAWSFVWASLKQARLQKPYASNGKDTIYLEKELTVKEFVHYSINGERVYDVRRENKFSEPPQSIMSFPIQPPEEANTNRATSPARSEVSAVGSIANSVAGPEEIISYPMPDNKGLLVNVSNPKLFAWLPSNPAKDYVTHVLPNGSTVVTSESLGLLKFAFLILLRSSFIVCVLCSLDV